MDCWGSKADNSHFFYISVCSFQIKKDLIPPNPILQYSNTPVFHCSRSFTCAIANLLWLGSEKKEATVPPWAQNNYSMWSRQVCFLNPILKRQDALSLNTFDRIHSFEIRHSWFWYSLFWQFLLRSDWLPLTSAPGLLETNPQLQSDHSDDALWISIILVLLS